MGKTTDKGKNGFFGIFGDQEVFFDRPEAHTGQILVADDERLFQEMRQEFYDCTDPRVFHITSNLGKFQTDLPTEWEFVAEPTYVRLYPGQKRGPTLQADGARTRQPIPLSKFMAHAHAKMANLMRVEVLALRLWTGPSSVVLNVAMRNAHFKKGKRNCLPDLRSLQFNKLDVGGKGFITLEELKQGLTVVMQAQEDQETTKYFKTLVDSGPRFNHRFSNSQAINKQEFDEFVQMESGCGKRDWGACKRCAQCCAKCSKLDCRHCNAKQVYECTRKDLFRCRDKSTSCSKCAPGCDSFTHTIAVINSAIKKLSKAIKLAQGRLLYRGIHSMAYPKDLLETGGDSPRSFVELGFSSCSTDKHVALEYSKALFCRGSQCEAFAHDKGICDQHKPTVLEISTGQLDCGAALRW